MESIQTANKTADVIILDSRHGYELHKTLLSLITAAHSLHDTSIHIVVPITNLSGTLSTYLATNEAFLTEHSITVVPYEGALDFSRLQSPGSTQTVLMTAGDCIATHSLQRLLESAQESLIAYPQTDVRYFKNQHKLNVIYENVDFPSDPKMASLAVWRVAGFAHFLVVPSDAVRDYFFPAPQPGYGHDTWHLVMTLLTKGYALSKVPRTAIFTLFSLPEKDYILPFPSTAYDLSTIRASLPEGYLSELLSPSLKERIKDRLGNHPTLTKGAQKSLHYASIIKKSVKRPTRIGNDLDAENDQWLISEAAVIHSQNANVFLSIDRRFHFQRIFESLSENLKVGDALSRSIKCLRHDQYDYVLLVPWLIAGGADMFFINYANAVARLRPDKNVLVISTEPSRKSLSNAELGLSDAVDFLHLAELVGEHKESDVTILTSIAALIDIFKVTTIHVGLSRLGYTYVDKYRDAIKSSGHKIILTGYNEIITDRQRREGYVHDIIPAIYDLADIVTTDNNEIAQLWHAEYGLDTSKIVVHHQPFSFPDTTRVNRNSFSGESPVRVLWASHMRKEKNPITYVDIAKAFRNDPSFTFTAYGALDRAHFRKNPFTHNVSTNMTYGGTFKSFFKEINPDLYDVFVYTSLADGTPNILIEAGLAHLPIISSRVGGIGKLIGEDGVLIKNPKDTAAFVEALRAFKADPTVAYQKAASFKNEIIKHHTIGAFQQEVEAMLKAVDY